MDVGIVIAVSEYKGDAASLPACKRDGDAFVKILQSDKKFGEILVIDSDTSASNVKNQLTDIVSKLKGQEISSVVFYFTGHGAFIDDEFYFLFTDYSQRRLNQTALANKELDSLFRSLNPGTYVKIVDACQSGFHYIKSRDAIADTFKAGVNAFNSVYFMFSSQSDQSSYQDAFLSDFTESIIRSIFNKPEGRVRYKDIIDVVSDDFASSSRQSPIFVTQANFTDVFCDVSVTLKNILEPFIRDIDSSNSRKFRQTSRVDLIRADALRYCDEQTAVAALERMSVRIEEIFVLNEELSELFKQSVEVKNTAISIDAAEVGKMIGNNKDYFARPEYQSRTVKKRVSKNRYSILAGLGSEEYEYVDEVEKVVSGYKNSVSLPYEYIIVREEPLLSNLPLALIFIAPIVSQVKIKLFYCYILYNNKDWSSRTSFKKESWASIEFEIREPNAMDQCINEIHSGYIEFINEYLSKVWGEEKG